MYALLPISLEFRVGESSGLISHCFTLLLTTARLSDWIVGRNAELAVEVCGWGAEAFWGQLESG